MERKGLIYDLRFLISDWRFGNGEQIINQKSSIEYSEIGWFAINRFLISDLWFGETDLKSSIVNRGIRDQEIWDYSIFDLRSAIWRNRSEIINHKSSIQRSRDVRLLDRRLTIFDFFGMSRSEIINRKSRNQRSKDLRLLDFWFAIGDLEKQIWNHQS